MNNLIKYLPPRSEICKWNKWNRIYQGLYERARALIKKDTCMKFFDEKKLLYIEIDASGVGLRSGLLQVRKGYELSIR